jgi:hypothetical protein
VVRARTGHLLVRPIINGHDAGYFLFDTGAAICVVSTPAMAPLGLEPAGSTDAVGVGGTTEAQLFRAARLELGPLRLRDHTFLATDLSFLEPHVGHAVAGVVGYGLLSQCIAELDLATPSLALHDPARYRLDGAVWTELDLQGRTPAIRARCEGREGLFQIDTGQDTAIVCHWPTVQKWNLTDGRELRPARLRGVGGDIEGRAGALAWVEFGGVRQEQVDSLFLVEAKGSRAASQRDGAIGSALLRPFVIITDYGNTRVAFRARARPAS